MKEWIISWHDDEYHPHLVKSQGNDIVDAIERKDFLIERKRIYRVQQVFGVIDDEYYTIGELPDENARMAQNVKARFFGRWCTGPVEQVN